MRCYAESACYKRMFQRYIANVSYGCCKSGSGCCICCDGCTCMLQAFVLNVFICFLDVCCKCVHLDVAYILHIRCKCFICILCMFVMFFKCFQVFLQVFQMYVSSVLSVICFRLYVKSVASRRFKSRSRVTRVNMSRKKKARNGTDCSHRRPPCAST
jgi:hypothetical protein